MEDQVGQATFVYAGSYKSARIELWKELHQIRSLTNTAWIVGGDFNCIASPAAKRGGRNPSTNKMTEFNDNINSAGLFDLGFNGSEFTWRRGKIWERLDRLLANDSWIQNYLQADVTHLSLARSDHRPMLISISANEHNSRPPFRYLNKKTAKALSNWNWSTFGNILTRVEQAKKELQLLEEGHSKGQVGDSFLLEANKKLLNAVEWQEQFLKQKGAKNKFMDGDRNTKFYHSCIKYQRKCNTIHSIQDNQGNWIRDAQGIADSVMAYCKDLMHCELTERQHVESELFQDEKDICPDGFTVDFYKKAWQVIKVQIVEAIQHHFMGQPLPDYFNTATIIFVPKSSVKEYWSSYRTISLTNIISKIISKILVFRIQPILQNLISPKQAAFVKGRNIGDNIKIAQELLLDLDKPCRGSNMIFKLDLKKAYDMINWNFIKEIMKARGFTKDSCKIIQRWHEGNVNSVLINGKTHGFFKANRGLRQGHPLSPTIFIWALDYLSKIIDKPGNRKDYNTYLNRSKQDINHLIYAVDILIFSRANKNDIKHLYADLQEF
ncbi:uncharacterized protein LOC110036431 [Phalaenopsis equestris]|uniref:uncharacterized protein LOC110036431 n=1 Tax=Phalaenopsis equestris TaxID=78828 RepID=UPI0009E1D266|nr:uncharacterized protein LOC110036431 [Phalaenopsis equestris]